MIYAIIGPTCVGKTKLSIALAKKINAEIINCDSMQIYRELNIGVAKITEEEKENIPHHLFDIVSVKNDFSVYDYQKLARAKITEILDSGKNVILVGGTGLYLKAVLYKYDFNGYKTDEKYYDNFQIIGLTKDRKKLYDDINKRVDIMLESGLETEVKNLYDNQILTRAVNTAIGYKELYEYFDGKITKEEAIEKIKLNSRRYAKRQYTFFNHQFETINWYNVEELTQEEIITDIIKKNNL